VIHGIDTTFLIQIEASRHPNHQKSRSLFDRLLKDGDSFAIAPQVLAEFIHVITDPKRFELPLTPGKALDRAQTWWTAREVVQVFPDTGSTRLFFNWMTGHRLGRKRILDTQLAATYYQAGIRSILSTNARDYTIFDCFEVLGE
jgi:predicted nucleic acid-binding protein